MSAWWACWTTPCGPPAIPTLYVTHDQDEAFAIADRVAVLAHGRLLQVAEPSQLWRAPAGREVAEFLGYGPFLDAGGGRGTRLAGRGRAGRGRPDRPGAGPVGPCGRGAGRPDAAWRRRDHRPAPRGERRRGC